MNYDTTTSSELPGINSVPKPRDKQRKKLAIRLRGIKPYLYLLPVLLSLGFWIYRPLIETFQLSFYQWNLLPTSPKEYVGWDNFKNLFTLPEMGAALTNTLIYTIGVVPFSLIVPLFIAIFTENISKRSRNVYRALIFLPMIMAPVAVSSIWRWIMHPTNGILNRTLQYFGLEEPIHFFTDERWAIYSIIFITGWKLIGFSTLIFSAALTGINKEYYEAAKIDRASRWQMIRHITLPLLSPSILFMGMLSILFASEWSFSYVNVLTQGGPLDSTTNIYYLLWQYGFQTFAVGWSSAAAVVLFIGFGLIALGFMKLSKKLTFFDD
ncbi:sugar ABC transporter permease [Paenibacillus urinalis]|uniref:Sugar ABC transporter permease n=1 Tax=Paenibacillus urinalis TaxID=521520 RepID=A0AAX3MZ16_9BACL|nr:MULTISPECIES: sugar ABC transporter permease [Paenibacillus]WDH81614.1 sugar ABC transporter permease [Paenibacillus urinalis]WDH97657.1 sugar ABC transporter permease [Paenibacillus urinalis]WDI01331.1 sugar ABC transporter permease [Paenibacillus urinalis]GAK39599.1 sugar ABC transporter permease protein [Paenibacillus sp. TCA20]